MKYNKELILIYKHKDFLEFGFLYNKQKNNNIIFFFFEDLLKKNNVNFLKVFCKNYSYDFRKVKKMYLKLFSPFFLNFKGSSIFCNSFDLTFFINFLNFLKINKDVLFFYEIKPLIFIFKNKLYDVTPFLNLNSINKPLQDIYNLVMNIFVNFIFILQNK